MQQYKEIMSSRQQSTMRSTELHGPEQLLQWCSPGLYLEMGDRRSGGETMNVDGVEHA